MACPVGHLASVQYDTWVGLYGIFQRDMIAR